jgi:hypothetical protein
MGRNREAAEQSERGLALARAQRITFWVSRIEANLAIARVRLGQLDVGPSLAKAADFCRGNAEGHQLARCLEGLAELSLARGDAAACLAYAGELFSLVQPGGLRELAAQARRWRGEALAFMNDPAAARKELTQAMDVAEDIGRVRLICDTRAALQRLPP